MATGDVLVLGADRDKFNQCTPQPALGALVLVESLTRYADGRHELRQTVGTVQSVYDNGVVIVRPPERKAWVVVCPSETVSAIGSTVAQIFEIDPEIPQDPPIEVAVESPAVHEEQQSLLTV